MKSSTALPVLIAPVLLAVGTLTAARTAAASDDVMHVNGSVSVAEGQHAGNVTTVNGSVDIGANAVIGSAHTVNGVIHLAHDTTATSAGTVNGAIHLGQHSHVTGDVQAVNGELELENGASVGGSVGTVLNAAHVGGRIKTVTGDIDLGPGSEVDGDLIVERSHGTQISARMPRIVIGPGAVVKGKLRFEHPVKLYVSDRATIGAVEGATPERFSGDVAP
jgi:hypothetical protein